jgi:hypothetical protein
VRSLGIALNDFGVACWHSKWHYKVERPENFIKREIDPQWEPLLVNKIDGVKWCHSCFSCISVRPCYIWRRKSAIILENIFGANYEYLDNCHALRNLSLTVNLDNLTHLSALVMKMLNRESFLGVHFRMDCDAGVELGRQIASSVLNQFTLEKMSFNKLILL